jgi:DNA-binding NtrC family response regulator
VLLSRDGAPLEDLLELPMAAFSDLPAGNTDSASAGHSLRAIAAAAAAAAEREAISEALHAAKGNKSAVARLLGVDYKTLHLKLKRYGICARNFAAL